MVVQREPATCVGNNARLSVSIVYAHPNILYVTGRFVVLCCCRLVFDTAPFVILVCKEQFCQFALQNPLLAPVAKGYENLG
jgi:hypothetical protein